MTGWGSSASPVAQPRHRDSSLAGTARVPSRPDFAGELPGSLLPAEPADPEGAVGCGRGRPLAFRVPAGFADRLQTAVAPPVLVPGREQERRVALAAPDRLLSDAGGGRSGSPSRSAPVAGRFPGSPRPRSARSPAAPAAAPDRRRRPRSADVAPRLRAVRLLGLARLEQDPASSVFGFCEVRRLSNVSSDSTSLPSTEPRPKFPQRGG